MKTREETDLDNMALAAELARQLCHDFSNFLYNLFMQIEISRIAPAQSTHEQWDAVKREGDKIVRLLRDWEQFHKRFAFSQSAVDLHEVIRQVARDASTKERTIHLAAAIAVGSLVVSSAPVDCKHLLRLLVEDFFQALGARAVSIQTQTVNQKALVRITAEGAGACQPGNDAGGDAEPLTLIGAACRSLAVRLDATIERELDAAVVRVEFPLA